MASTTIHFPDNLLSKIDQAAKRHNISRNKYFLKACEEALEKEEGEWPEKFFTPNLSDKDLLLLREGTKELESEIYSHRHNTGAPIL